MFDIMKKKFGITKKMFDINLNSLQCRVEAEEEVM